MISVFFVSGAFTNPGNTKNSVPADNRDSVNGQNNGPANNTDVCNYDYAYNAHDHACIQNDGLFHIASLHADDCVHTCVLVQRTQLQAGRVIIPVQQL